MAGMGHHGRADSGRYDTGEPGREEHHAGEPAVSVVCASLGGSLSCEGGDLVWEAARAWNLETGENVWQGKMREKSCRKVVYMVYEIIVKKGIG